ncbi:MAG: adenylate/guanylate cyclase domain-containing protein [Paracoccaceae bacterium]
MKIRLHIGVASAFTILTVAILGLVVAFLFFSNRELALSTAQSQMEKARERSIEDVSTIIADAGRVADVVSSFVAAYPEGVRSKEALEVLRTLIDGNDQYYGAYFALEGDGSFYQVVNLAPEITAFGPGQAAVPTEARHVMRILDTVFGTSEVNRDRLYWMDEKGAFDLFSSVDATFDPRVRPWYEGAAAQSDLFVSPLYIFQSTGRSGVTFSRRILDKTGRFIGVAGVDLTMANFGRILDHIRVGEEGFVFLIGANGDVIAVTSTRKEAEPVLFLPEGAEGNADGINPTARAAILAAQSSATGFFQFDAGPDERTYVGSVGDMAPIFGLEPTLGFAVPATEIVGEIVQATFRILQITALVLLVAVALIFILSLLLSRDLHRVTATAEKIRNFDLGETKKLQSSIAEFSELGKAMDSMKAGLQSFGAYVPKELVRSIISSGRSVAIEGEAREVSILFSDLQGFTSQSEGMSPSDLMPALSEYFAAMESEIAGQSGTVDKYIGDAIMALWNAPSDDPDHAAHACRAALACLRVEAQMNAAPGGSALGPLHTRIGLHCGPSVVGNIGSLSRMQYTALGATVNLTSRLEGLNKAYGTRILATSAMVTRAGPGFVFREVDLMTAAGTTEPVAIHELIGETGDALALPAKEVEDWQQCLDLYRAAEWDKAAAALAAHRETCTNPALVQVYLDRCAAFQANLPGPDWDGTFHHNKK